MNIAKALKEKNKLVKEYNSLITSMIHNNSRMIGTKSHYNSYDLLEKAIKLQDEIVSLKTRIHKASEPVREDIFKLSELKNLLSHFSSLDTTEGLKIISYSSDAPREYTADINEIKKIEFIKQCEKEIEVVQDKLDSFNATTIVEEEELPF